jgi:methylated-DNA-[protein]-cysteine S-methyltransferase
MNTEPKKAACEYVETPVGTILITATDAAVTGVNFVETRSTPQPNAQTRQCAKQLDEYFAGERTAFTVPLMQDGTPFQKKVWKAIARIGFGKQTTYGDIAAAIGNPHAVRAVGTAVGKNNLCIIVPCHRVVPADGTLGNYTPGPAKKAFLLTLEHRGS